MWERVGEAAVGEAPNSQGGREGGSQGAREGDGGSCENEVQAHEMKQNGAH